MGRGRCISKPFVQGRSRSRIHGRDFICRNSRHSYICLSALTSRCRNSGGDSQVSPVRDDLHLPRWKPDHLTDKLGAVGNKREKEPRFEGYRKRNRLCGGATGQEYDSPQTPSIVAGFALCCSLYPAHQVAGLPSLVGGVVSDPSVGFQAWTPPPIALQVIFWCIFRSENQKSIG
jgi:hypothetical protein